MEATTAGYVHTGVMVVAIGLMILHGILLRVAPVKRFMRQQWKYLRVRMQKAPARGMVSAGILSLTAAALMGVFFWQFFFAMQGLLGNDSLAWLKSLLYWIGFLLAMDLTCVGGWIFTASLWTALQRRTERFDDAYNGWYPKPRVRADRPVWVYEVFYSIRIIVYWDDTGRVKYFDVVYT